MGKFILYNKEICYCLSFCGLKLWPENCPTFYFPDYLQIFWSLLCCKQTWEQQTVRPCSHLKCMNCLPLPFSGLNFTLLQKYNLVFIYSVNEFEMNLSSPKILQSEFRGTVHCAKPSKIRIFNIFKSVVHCPACLMTTIRTVFFTGTFIWL